MIGVWKDEKVFALQNIRKGDFARVSQFFSNGEKIRRISVVKVVVKRQASKGVK